MNWKAIEHVAENSSKQWYFNQSELAVILGCNRKLVASFVADHAIPHRRIGGNKIFFLPEVLEAVERTRGK